MVKQGDFAKIKADTGCMTTGAVLPVAADASGDLYVPCSHGKHFLGEDGLEEGPDFEVVTPEAVA